MVMRSWMGEPRHEPERARLQTTPREEREAAADAGNSAEDYVYQALDVARVLGKLVRPVHEEGQIWDRQHLLWSFLLRSIQTHGYIHACTMAYCMKNRSTCRFFFPWPEVRTQQYDENLKRVAT